MAMSWPGFSLPGSVIVPPCYKSSQLPGEPKPFITTLITSENLCTLPPKDPKKPAAKMSSAHHSRSHSMPSELHPVMARIDEELNRLELPGSPTTSPTSSSMAQRMGAAFAVAGLQRLHSCVEELLRLPLSQRAFACRRHEKWVAEELDGSIRLLDLSGTASDLLSAMKEQVRDLESHLRRKGEHGIAKSIGAYLQSRRKAQRDINKCLAALKGMHAKSGSAAPLEQNCELSTLVRLLSQVRAATVALICSVLSLMAMPKPQARSSKWSLDCRAMGKGRKIVCVGKPDHMHEAESADAVLAALYGRVSIKDVDGEKMAMAQKQLEMMEAGIEGIVAGFECLSRQLIQNRVSLLNILSA